eukprot:g6207.t1
MYTHCRLLVFILAFSVGSCIDSVSPKPKTTAEPKEPPVVKELTYPQKIKACRKIMKTTIKKSNAYGPLLKAGFLDAASFDKNCKDPWPLCGGANGNLHYPEQYNKPAYKGIKDAIIVLSGVKQQCPGVTWADLIQLGAVISVETAQGNSIRIKYGRKDAPLHQLDPDWNLPAYKKPYPDGSVSAAEHLRRVFCRMGLNDTDIVALSGAHTLGRAFYADGAEMWTNYTVFGPGKVGGSSWTPDWLTFNNQYFQSLQTPSDPELIAFETDKALFIDPIFKTYAEKYADDCPFFRENFVESYIKLSELGVEWIVGGPYKV